MTARDKLTSALVILAAEGGRPPCGDFDSHGRWTSDDPAERMVAVVLCAPCTLLEVCGAAGDEGGESFGVWGGRDLTKTTRRKKI